MIQTDEGSQAHIDRLVDGELTEREQHDLLLSCEGDPTRWRDVALAFIEAQTWSTEMKVNPRASMV